VERRVGVRVVVGLDVPDDQPAVPVDGEVHQAERPVDGLEDEPARDHRSERDDTGIDQPGSRGAGGARSLAGGLIHSVNHIRPRGGARRVAVVGHTGRHAYADRTRVGRSGRAMSVVHLVSSGPLLLAIPVAAAAGAVTFLSPCCLPLVPGYLAYITGMSGADATAAPAGELAVEGAAGTAAVAAEAGGGVTTQARTKAAAPAARHTGRTVAGTALFVAGFSAVFALTGLAVGGLGQLFSAHDSLLTQVLGGVTIVLGLLFFGAFDRFMFAGRVFKPSVMPRAGLTGAPLLGVLFGIGWTPCIGPTLEAVQTLSFSTGTAARGAFLALVYGLGLGIPFLIVAALFERTLSVMAFFKRHARLVTGIGGILLIALGLFEATGTWTTAVAWMHTHWFQTYTPQL